MADDFDVEKDGLSCHYEDAIVVDSEVNGAVVCFGWVTQYLLLDELDNMGWLHDLNAHQVVVLLVAPPTPTHLSFVNLVFELVA